MIQTEHSSEYQSSSILPNQLQAVRQYFGFGEFSGYSLLTIQGQDAKRFLQNQTTQDVEALAPGSQALAASVDRQGKLQGVFTLYPQSETQFDILIESAQVSGLLAHWEKYKLFDQFEIVDHSQHTPHPNPPPQGERGQESSRPQFGSKLFCILGAQFTDAQVNLINQNLKRLPLIWAGLQGTLFAGPSDTDVAQFSTSLKTNHPNAVELNAELLNALRIEAGLPQFGVDMDNDTLLPETGLHDASVSYSKGCYLGQEVIAKIKTYGRVPKALAGLIFDPSDRELFSKLEFNTPCLDGKQKNEKQNDDEKSGDQKSVGILKSALLDSSLGYPIALAYLNREHRTPGDHILFSVSGKTLKATVTLLPFVSSNAIIASQNENREEQLHQALTAFAQGEDDSAMSTLRKLLENYSESNDTITSQAMEALGVILGRHGQTEEAIEWMQRLLEINPDSIMAHTNLSIFYLKLGDKELAEEEKAKATIAGMRQKAKEAGFDFKKLDEERAKREQEKITQLEERIQLFKDALSFSPDDPLGNYGLGSVLLELKRFDEAITPLEKTIKAQPNHSVAHLMLGKAYEFVGEQAKAKAIYEKGISVAASKGDRMPLEEMQQRLSELNTKK